MVAFLMQVIDLLSKKSGDAFLEFRRRSGGFNQRLFMLEMSFEIVERLQQRMKQLDDEITINARSPWLKDDK